MKIKDLIICPFENATHFVVADKLYDLKDTESIRKVGDRIIVGKELSLHKDDFLTLGIYPMKIKDLRGDVTFATSIRYTEPDKEAYILIPGFASQGLTKDCKIEVTITVLSK